MAAVHQVNAARSAEGQWRSEVPGTKLGIDGVRRGRIVCALLPGSNVSVDNWRSVVAGFHALVLRLKLDLTLPAYYGARPQAYIHTINDASTE